MADISHVMTRDIGTSVTGDLAVATDLTLSTQRVLRRLLTNPGDYIWRPTYGAGLARFIGSTVSARTIQALILSQMLMEPSVAATPAPIIAVTSSPGQLTVSIRYVEADSGQTAALNFTVTP